MLSKNPDATGYYQNSDNPKWLVSAVEKLSDLALHLDEVVSKFKI